ncbi:hypothetical protein LG634_19890 [Streptomyces bambusae]|uniref:hypothetical protein n=1 Tax=Streptomyces bambusae TaxID=1550616 RepID=UPI001CFC597F|nr:hypothetical protein [Streptomyces bambusae]MCB5167090.1 hypothetical protein [Streptomyces bambusae]
MLLGRHPRTAAWAAAAVLVLAPVAAGCSDGSDDNGADASPAATTPLPPAVDATAPADPAGATAQVKQNWARFFDPKTATGERIRLLENGEELRPVLLAFAADPNTAKTSSVVKEVSFTSATDANVTYDLLVSGAPVLPAAKGTAVYEDQVWKVSQKSLCALVQLSGNAVPGC